MADHDDDELKKHKSAMNEILPKTYPHIRDTTSENLGVSYQIVGIELPPKEKSIDGRTADAVKKAADRQTSAS